MNVLTAVLALSPHLAVAHPVWVQGALTNAGGAVDGSYDLSLAFYAGATTPLPLASQSFLGVQVADGVFAVAVDALPEPALAAAELWVGVSVVGEPELTRQRLGAVPFAQLSDTARGLRCEGCVRAEHVAKNAIYTEALQDGIIGTKKLAPSAVEEVNIAEGSVGSLALQSFAVLSYHLADGAVTTAALAPLAVTNAKLAVGAVTSASVLDGTLEADDLADRAVGSLQLAQNAVTTEHVPVKGIDSTRILFGVDTGTFCNATTPTKIKNANEAIFCALSWVDYDTADGWCRVSQGVDGWYVQTGGGCSANACAWVCLQ